MRITKVDFDVRDQMPKNPNPKRKYSRRKLDRIDTIVLHCDDADHSCMNIAKYDVTPNPKHHISKLGCPGITYAFFVEKDGITLHCSDMENVTWHASGHNSNSIGVCLRYRATGNKNPPPACQLSAAVDLIADLCLELFVDPDDVQGHRELEGTGYEVVNGTKKLLKTCPGLLVNMDQFRYRVAVKVQKWLKTEGWYTSPIDGRFGPRSERAMEKYKQHINEGW